MRMTETTTIEITQEQKETLDEIKMGDESYRYVLGRLIESYENPEVNAESHGEAYWKRFRNEIDGLMPPEE